MNLIRNKAVQLKVYYPYWIKIWTIGFRIHMYEIKRMEGFKWS